MVHPWEGGKKLYKNGPGHMTKMAAMLKYKDSPPMILKLRMEHYELYINDDPELNTYFTTMSNLAKIVFVLTVGSDIR